MRHLFEFLDMTIRFVLETVHKVPYLSDDVSGIVSVTTFRLLDGYRFAIFVVEPSGNYVGLMFRVPRNYSNPLSVIPVPTGNKDTKRLFLKDLLDVIVGSL